MPPSGQRNSRTAKQPDPDHRDGQMPAQEDHFLALVPDEHLEQVLASLAPGARRDAPEVRAARIELDRRLVERIAAQGFKGRDYEKLVERVYQYSYPIVHHLITTGQIFAQAKRLQRPIRRHEGDYHWTGEDCAWLAERSVDEGVLNVFCQVGLKQARWDHTRGTALSTYGVNASVRSFPRVYQQWWRSHQLEDKVSTLQADGLPFTALVDPTQPDPAEHAVTRIEAKRLLSQLPQPLRRALWLRAVDDLGQAAAAAATGMTEKAMESQLTRARKRMGLIPRKPTERRNAQSNENNTQGRGQ